MLVRDLGPAAVAYIAYDVHAAHHSEREACARGYVIAVKGAHDCRPR